MPFSCKSGPTDLYAQDLCPAQWEDLKLRVLRGSVTLTLPCCGAKVALRSGSRKRQQHFAHFRGQNCANDAWGDYRGTRTRGKERKPRSHDHEYVQEIIRQVAERCGWSSFRATAGSPTYLR